MNKVKKVKKSAKLKISYNAVIEDIDKYTGKVLKRVEVHNTIVNNGLERIAKLLGKISSVGFDYLAVGTDATAVQVTDTELGVEVVREQAVVTYEAGYKTKFVKVFSVGSGVSHSIKEVGIFDQAGISGSTMWARVNADNTLSTDTNLSVTITYVMAGA